MTPEQFTAMLRRLRHLGERDPFLRSVAVELETRATDAAAAAAEAARVRELAREAGLLP